jgi:uncharacterized protein (TIGR03000 family)
MLVAILAAPCSFAQPPGRPALSMANYYSPPAPAPAPVLNAVIEVRLPGEAELWFDKAQTAQTGERRIFTTPPLEPGVTYTYDVSARWRRQGREVARGQLVTIRAGEAVVVDLGSRDGGAPQMAVREIPREAPAVPAALTSGHGSLTEIAGGRVPARPLPGHMAVIELDGQPARTIPTAPGRMSIMEFDRPPLRRVIKP